MIPISKYIGKEVRRIVFAVCKKDKTFHNLLTIIERLNDDMQDINAFSPNCGNCYCDRIEKADGDADKIYIAVERVVLTEEMLKEPWSNIVVGKDPLAPVVKEFQSPTKESIIIPLHSDDKNELKSILPHRKQAAYVKYYVPCVDNELVQYVLSDKHLKAQLKELSERNLGVDLTLHKKYLGGYILVCYNDIYHSIEMTEDREHPGIYFRVNYRYGKHDVLYFHVRLFAKDGNIIGDRWLCNDGKFLIYLNVCTSFHSISLDVYDAEKTLIDYYPRTAFIHTIALSASFKSKDVVVKDALGAERTVEKYTEDITTYIGKKPQINTLFESSPEYSYKRFEDSLDFVFFDGEKDSRDKARACVMRILNSAHRYCYICDIYFHSGTLTDFVLGMKNDSVKVRILTSKEKLNAEDRENLKKCTKEFNVRQLANVSCRLLKGKAALHDRLIIADDKVWMLGCSLNEFGIRATTLIRVPAGYSGKLKEKVEEWWNNPTMSEEV